MTLNVKMNSGRKGSNPGGICLATLPRGLREFYLKYCHSSGLPKDSSLTPINQPIYEAITSEMAKKLGLIVPVCYVLHGGNINFSGEPLHLNGINPRLPFYFISEMINLPRSKDEEKIKIAMEKEAPYRDILLVSDIVGKRQNYDFFNDEENMLLYLDLGCSFVNATDGKLTMKNFLKNRPDSKEIRKMRKRLNGYFILPRDSNADDFIPIDYITDISPDFPIPVIDSITRKESMRKLESLLSAEEIDEIRDVLAWGVGHNIKDLSDSGILLRQ